MLNMADSSRPAFFPSHGVGGPVTCSACGCRLQVDPGHDDRYRHFNPIAGHDARGCRVACVDDAHDASGRPLGSVLV